MKCGKSCVLTLVLGLVLVLAGFYFSKSLIPTQIDDPIEVSIDTSEPKTTVNLVTTANPDDALLKMESVEGIGCPLAFNLSDTALLSLPQQTFKTHHTWSKEADEFSGPLLQDVLNQVCPKASKLKLKAINDYQVDLDFDKIKQYEPVLALSMNGERLTIRNKGPIWIMIPFDKYTSVPERSLDEALVWQLSHIKILEAK